jgi:hypothetical protein
VRELEGDDLAHAHLVLDEPLDAADAEVISIATSALPIDVIRVPFDDDDD